VTDDVPDTPAIPVATPALSAPPGSTVPAPLLVRLRPRWQRPAVLANLVGQVLIVVTGGAVRLTGSGLGCSTWPQCEPGSFVPEVHEAATYHPFVEFGNRTITGVLVVLAVAVVLLAALDRRRSAAYRALAWVPLGGVLLQAVLGGITVLVDLHPAVVASHFLVSMVLVAASSWLLVRTDEGDGPALLGVPRVVRTVTWVAVGLAGVVLALGSVTTGSGPHSGDDEVGYRFALDPLTMARVHAGAVWLFVGALAFALYALQRVVRRADRADDEAPAYRAADGAVQPARGFAPVHDDAAGARRALRAGYVLLGVAAAQGLIGYVQVATGLPIALVNLHMLGAALLVVALARFLGAQRTRGLVRPEPVIPDPADAGSAQVVAGA
jgi:cytochrome c oxidase assembly protein subunit 15